MTDWINGDKHLGLMIVLGGNGDTKMSLKIEIWMNISIQIYIADYQLANIWCFVFYKITISLVYNYQNHKTFKKNKPKQN